MIQYPYEIKEGDTFTTNDGRVWTVSSYNGKFIITKEGAQYSPRHPEIIGFESVDFINNAAKEEDDDKQSKRSSKKKSKYAQVEETENNGEDYFATEVATEE